MFTQCSRNVKHPRKNDSLDKKYYNMYDQFLSDITGIEYNNLFKYIMLDYYWYVTSCNRRAGRYDRQPNSQQNKEDVNCDAIC